MSVCGFCDRALLLVLEEVELRVADRLEPDSDTFASGAIDAGNVVRSAWCKGEVS